MYFVVLKYVCSLVQVFPAKFQGCNLRTFTLYVTRWVDSSVWRKLVDKGSLELALKTNSDLHCLQRQRQREWHCPSEQLPSLPSAILAGL